jgi:hypothetical protein
LNNKKRFKLDFWKAVAVFDPERIERFSFHKLATVLKGL